ncbi:MAG: hypothetical protein ACRDOL_39600, partial [Streptosporangiaceae bacterium]
MAGGSVRRATAIVQHGQLAHLDADIPFFRPALFYDRSWQPRPLLAVVLLDGLITNDKFCCVRRVRLSLTWWRRPLRLRLGVQDRAGMPHD